MCTSTRMIYILTYRAIRAAASGRTSTNPIVAMQQLEAVVPMSVCRQTHDTMLKAQKSFNQKFIAPVGVHEVDCYHIRSWMGTLTYVETSTLRQCSPETIKTRLHFMRCETYAHHTNGYHNRLHKLDAIAPMPQFTVPDKPGVRLLAKRYPKFDWALFAKTLPLSA